MLSIHVRYRFTLQQIKVHPWFKRDTVRKRHSFGMGSPDLKRQRVFGSAVVKTSASQPTPVIAKDVPEDEHDSRLMHHFTQPDRIEDMLLSTQAESQMSSSQSRPSQYQKLVKRMTRFFTSVDPEETFSTLTSHFDRVGYVWKKTSAGQLTVETIDKRKNPLVFKTTIIVMSGTSILVDFRLSRVRCL